MDREGKVRALRLAVTSWPVRLLLSGSALRLLLLPFAASGGWLLVALEIAASVLLAIGLAWAIWLLIVRLQRRLLWRVRRRLVLSYVFIGFVPVLLVVAFFSVAGTMSVLSTSAELVRRELDRVVGDTQVVRRRDRGPAVARDGCVGGARARACRDRPALRWPLGCRARSARQRAACRRRPVGCMGRRRIAFRTGSLRTASRAW